MTFVTSNSLQFDTATVAATQAAGRAMAKAILVCNPGALLLQGTLGAGKTTFTRALVSALPGSEGADVSSPSFTLCNEYPTHPKVHHFDLYRLGKKTQTDALADSFDEEGTLTIVEWPEFIHKNDSPPDGVLCQFMAETTNSPRHILLTALGEAGKSLLYKLFLSVSHVHPF